MWQQSKTLLLHALAMDVPWFSAVAHCIQYLWAFSVAERHSPGMKAVPKLPLQHALETQTRRDVPKYTKFMWYQYSGKRCGNNNLAPAKWIQMVRTIMNNGCIIQKRSKTHRWKKRTTPAFSSWLLHLPSTCARCPPTVQDLLHAGADSRGATWSNKGTITTTQCSSSFEVGMDGRVALYPSTG